MTTVRERPPAEPDLDVEQEVDVRRYWDAAAARWWLAVAGLVVGAVLGLLLAVGGGDVYEAETTLYLGQPFSPTGNAPVQSLATNPTTVGQLARSESTFKKAARDSGMPLRKLRGNVSTQTVSPTGVRGRLTPGQVPLVELSVTGERAGQAQRAADSIARTIIGAVSGYANQKIELLGEQIATDQRDLEALDERLQVTNQQLNQAVRDRSLSAVERLTLITNFNSALGFGEQRRSIVQQDLLEARGLLSLAENVERARIVDPAAATKTSARSTGNSIAVGALIGLLLGVLAALVWEPIAARPVH